MQTTNTSTTAHQHYLGQLADYDVLLTWLHGAKASASVLEDIWISPQSHSPLAQEHDRGQIPLQKLLKDPGFQALCKRSNAVDSFLSVSVEADRGVYEAITLDQSTTTLPLADNPQWHDLTAKIEQMALSIGGQIRSDRLLSLPQILMYYGLQPERPQSAATLSTLILELEEKRASHRLSLENGMDLGNLIRQVDHQPILDAVSLILDDEETSVIDSLGKEALANLTDDQLRAAPTVSLYRLLNSSKARALAQRLLEVLGWYGARPDEETGPYIEARLVAEALRRWYSLTADEPDDTIARFRLEQPSNRGKSYQTLRREFESYLLDSGRATTTSEAILLARLLQSQLPAEFQVRDIPADLPYRSSLPWVNFVHGVNLAHAIEPGRVQRMTFQQLVDFALNQSMNASAQMLELISLTRVRPAVEWAETNGVLDEKTAQNCTQQEIDHALVELEKYSDALKNAITQLDVPPPERLAVATVEMAKLFGSKAFISDGHQLGRIAEPSSFRDTPRLKGHEYDVYSFLDVYASGKFDDQEPWTVMNTDGKTPTARWISITSDRRIQTDDSWIFIDPPKFYPVKNKVLPDISKLFDDSFNTYIDLQKTAYSTLIISQLLTLPQVDRNALKSGDVEVYTLRKTDDNGKLQPRLRKGFYLRVMHENNLSYYELIPWNGLVRRLSDADAQLIDKERLPDGKIKTVEQRRNRNWIPVNWAAHGGMSTPDDHASFNVLIRILGTALPKNDPSAPPTLFSERLWIIADFISQNLLYVDENDLRKAAQGETAFDRRQADADKIIAVLKAFVPFWSSIEDLASGDRTRIASGIFGLFVDIAAFIAPIGKFASGSFRLTMNAGKLATSTALPNFSTLSKTFFISSLQALNPLDGIPTLLRSGVRAAGRLTKSGLFEFKKLLGRSGHYDFVRGLPQVSDPGSWKPLASTDELACIKGIDDIPVRNTGPTHAPVFHAVEPRSGKPYGPSLPANADEFSLGRSAYSHLESTNSHVVVKLSDHARVREVLEIDGRTTWLIDDVPYRLDSDILRRVDLIDDSNVLKAVPCRPRRAPGGSACLQSYVTGEPAATPPPGSFDESKGYAPWFGERISTPATRPGHVEEFLTLDGKVYHGSGESLTLFKGDLTALGFTKQWLVPRKNISANLEFQKGIYGRVVAKGSYEGTDDLHRVGAILVQSIDESSTYVFTRLNTDKYYLATVSKGQSLREPLTLNRLLKADLADGTKGEELLRVYTGSLSANNVARIHGVEKLERAMKTMEEIAIPIGTRSTPAEHMKWLKVDTTPGEALMFDHSSRMIITKLPDGATTWSRSKVAPEDFRQRTAEIFDTLFLAPTIAPNKADSALRIDATMKRLHDLIPRHQRSFNPRNIAYADVTTAAGKREVYVSVSGAQGATNHLPLFKNNLGADQIKVGETTYFNIDLNQTFPKTSLEVTDEGKLLALPRTIEDINTYRPELTLAPTSLDSESKLISVIREKYPDREAIRSVDVATTMPPCESCSVVIKEFGYDGGKNALNVLWH